MDRNFFLNTFICLCAFGGKAPSFSSRTHHLGQGDAAFYERSISGYALVGQSGVCLDISGSDRTGHWNCGWRVDLYRFRRQRAHRCSLKVILHRLNKEYCSRPLRQDSPSAIKERKTEDQFSGPSFFPFICAFPSFLPSRCHSCLFGANLWAFSLLYR